MDAVIVHGDSLKFLRDTITIELTDSSNFSFKIGFVKGYEGDTLMALDYVKLIVTQVTDTVYVDVIKTILEPWSALFLLLSIIFIVFIIGYLEENY